ARSSTAQASAKAFATSDATFSKKNVFGTASRSSPAGIASGASAGSPAMTASVIAQQATLLASGPIESSVVESGIAPSRGTRNCVGLNPTTPQRAAGTRTEPPVSVPIATTA